MLMGFFWGCSCCVDFIFLGTDHIVGKKWGTTTGDDAWVTAHGLGSQGGRKQMSADGTHVWIAGPISSNQTIQKYDLAGSLIDSIAFAAENLSQPNGLARDQNGNFGIGGSMTSPTERYRYLNSSGTRQWGYDTGSNAGVLVAFNIDDESICYFQSDTFIRKFDSSGSVVWTSNTTDIPNSWGQTLEFDMAGNVLCGRNDGTVAFGKFDTDGTELWRSTSHQCRTDAIAAGPSNVILMGGRSTVTSNASKIIKWDEDGNELETDTIANFTLRGIAVAPDGRVVAVGITAGLSPNVGIGFTWEDDWTAGASFEYLDAAGTTDAIGSVIWKTGLITEWNPA